MVILKTQMKFMRDISKKSGISYMGKYQLTETKANRDRCLCACDTNFIKSQMTARVGVSWPLMSAHALEGEEQRVSDQCLVSHLPQNEFQFILLFLRQWKRELLRAPGGLVSVFFQPFSNIHVLLSKVKDIKLWIQNVDNSFKNLQ